MASKNNCKFLKLMNKPFQMLPSVTQIRNIFTVLHMAKVRKQKDIIKTKSCCKFSKISWLVSKRVQLDFKMKKLFSQLFPELFFCIDIFFLNFKEWKHSKHSNEVLKFQLFRRVSLLQIISRISNEIPSHKLENMSYEMRNRSDLTYRLDYEVYIHLI